MLEYLLEWLHLYSIHFGAIVALLLSLDVYIKGLPEVKEISRKLSSALIISSIIAIFSSHAQNHFITHFIKELK